MPKHRYLSPVILVLCLLLALVALPPMAGADPAGATPAPATTVDSATPAPATTAPATPAAVSPAPVSPTPTATTTPKAGGPLPAQGNLSAANQKELSRLTEELVKSFSFLYARVYVVDAKRAVLRRVAFSGNQAGIKKAVQAAGSPESREVPLAGASLLAKVAAAGVPEESATLSGVGMVSDATLAAAYQKAAGSGSCRITPVVRDGLLFGVIEVEVERSTFFPRERDVVKAYADEAALLLAAGAAASPSPGQSAYQFPGPVVTVSAPVHTVTVEQNVGMVTPDGVRLACDIYHPAEEGTFPAVVIRTPYGRGQENLAAFARYFSQRGYGVVIQDVRGKGDSQGNFQIYVNEAADGQSTLSWVSGQPWCDGHVALRGSTYEGGAAWLAASGNLPAAGAIFALSSPASFYEGVYTNGAFLLNQVAVWSVATSIVKPAHVSIYNWADVLNHMPVTDVDRYAVGRTIPCYRQVLDHHDYDSFWKNLDLANRYAQVPASTVSVSGWYDPFLNGALHNFNGMGSQAGASGAKHKLVIGPWSMDLNQSTLVGNVDFGPNTVVDLYQLELRWYDHFLKGYENGIDQEAPVRIFVMGDNVWRDEQEWPLARTQFTTYYLHSAGKANTLTGDGSLDTQVPSIEAPDSYTYDPADPPPTLGGSNGPFAGSLPMGPYDERPVEKRRDVLIYTSAPLTAPLEVTGPIQATIYAASAAQDTDFSVKLVDVLPDGTARILQNGIMRARYRKGIAHPDLLEPGRIYPLEIDLRATSNVFQAGHRIRVEIASADFPRFDRNLNTGDDNENKVGMIRATQTIYHDEQHPSHLVLPIIPR